MLDLGFDINTQNNQKCTPLHLACFNGQDVVVHELLESGADTNIPNENGWTSLHHAAASTHGALCLELLVNSGADVNVQNNEGTTPLHMTAVHGRFTRSQTLLHSGAKADYWTTKETVLCMLQLGMAMNCSCPLFWRLALIQLGMALVEDCLFIWLPFMDMLILVEN